MKLLWRTLFCLMHAYYTKDNSGKASSITSSERALYIQMSKLMLYLRIILLLFLNFNGHYESDISLRNYLTKI